MSDDIKIIRIDDTNPMYYVIQDWICNNRTYHDYDEFLFDNNISQLYDHILLPDELLSLIILETSVS